MPSPIAHSLAALTIARLIAPRLLSVRGMGIMLAAGFFSMLPDIDAIVGIGLADLGRFHNHMTHSLGFIGVVGLGTIVVVRVRRQPHALRWAGFVCGCMLLHVMMDFFTEGRGVMLLWPSMIRYESPVKLFFGLHWSEGLVSSLHLVTLLNELPLAILVLLLIWRARQKEALAEAL